MISDVCPECRIGACSTTCAGLGQGLRSEGPGGSGLHIHGLWDAGQGNGEGDSDLDSSPGSANHLLCDPEPDTCHKMKGAHGTEVPPRQQTLWGPEGQ